MQLPLLPLTREAGVKQKPGTRCIKSIQEKRSKGNVGNRLIKIILKTTTTTNFEHLVTLWHTFPCMLSHNESKMEIIFFALLLGKISNNLTSPNFKVNQIIRDGTRIQNSIYLTSKTTLSSVAQTTGSWKRCHKLHIFFLNNCVC